MFDTRVSFQIVKFQLPGARGNLSDAHKIKIKKPIRLPAHLGCRKAAPLHLSPFSPPDRYRWVDSPALSARGPDLPCHLVKVMVFPVVMYGCESWTVKKAECRRMDAFELWCWRRLLSPLDCKEIQPVYPKGNQSWVFIGRTDVEAETPILWPPDMKSCLI